MVTLFTKKKIKVVLSARIIIIEIWYFFEHRSMLQGCEDLLSTDYLEVGHANSTNNDADQKIKSIDQIGLQI